MGVTVVLLVETAIKYYCFFHL